MASAECILIKNDTIYGQERGHGVSPLLVMYDEHREAMSDAVLVDKVIGRAAAAIAICGKVKHVHGELMSEDAIEFLNKNGITTSYTILVHRILNRKRDWPLSFGTIGRRCGGCRKCSCGITQTDRDITKTIIEKDGVSVQNEQDIQTKVEFGH